MKKTAKQRNWTVSTYTEKSHWSVCTKVTYVLECRMSQKLAVPHAIKY